MKKLTLDANYRDFRLSKLNTSEYRHILMLLFWPVFLAVFTYAERGWKPDEFEPMYCRLDDLIPFNEFFVVPYVFWFVFLAGMLMFLFFYDVQTFKCMMKFIIITYGAALVVFFLFPNCQLLRPVEFERDNILTRFMARFYLMDTNTNVCPSIHVIGSFACMFAGVRCKHFQNIGMKIAFVAVSLLISASTVFLKQHSVIDVVAALPVCAFGYALAFGKKKIGV